MATILEFKLPAKPKAPVLVDDTVISSTVNDVMLMIHHALHGSDENCRPKDREFATKLLEELSFHIQNTDEDDFLILSHTVSENVARRYPEMHNKQIEQRN